MTPVLRFLQALLCFGICGSLAEENIFLSSDSGLSSSPLDDGGTQLSLGFDSASSVSEDPASAMFPLGDISNFLPLNGDNSEADMFSTGSIADLPLDEFTSSDEGFEIDPGSSSGLLASSIANCVSDGGQFIGRIRRRDNSCSAPAEFKKPSTDVQKPPNDPDEVFPPPGSNPGRLSGHVNDPKRRPIYLDQEVNTDFDFEYCPSGISGYRLYAVCDSGLERDRSHIGPTYTLYHVTRRKLIFQTFPSTNPVD